MKPFYKIEYKMEGDKLWRYYGEHARLWAAKRSVIHAKRDDAKTGLNDSYRIIKYTGKVVQ
jgi:hypothetical protein